MASTQIFFDKTDSSINIINGGTTLKVNSDGDINIDAGSNKVNINGTSPAAARVGDHTESDSSTDVSYWKLWIAFFTLLKSAVLPETGNGAPGTLGTALNSLVNSMSPLPQKQVGHITDGSGTVNIGD